MVGGDEVVAFEDDALFMTTRYAATPKDVFAFCEGEGCGGGSLDVEQVQAESRWCQGEEEVCAIVPEPTAEDGGGDGAHLAFGEGCIKAQHGYESCEFVEADDFEVVPMIVDIEGDVRFGVDGGCADDCADGSREGVLGAGVVEEVRFGCEELRAYCVALGFDPLKWC